MRDAGCGMHDAGCMMRDAGLLNLTDSINILCGSPRKNSAFSAFIFLTAEGRGEGAEGRGV